MGGKDGSEADRESLELSLELSDGERTLDTPRCSRKRQRDDISSIFSIKKRKTGDRQGGTPDGRICNGCGACDRDDDPVDLRVKKTHVPRSWGYPARGDSQQGRMCYYCIQVYYSKYKHKALPLAECVAQLGSCSEMMDKFRGYVKALIEYFINHGGRDCSVSWSQVETRTVAILTVNTTKIAEPDDELWDFDYYNSKKGNPATNGLGHRETWEHGKHEVVVPTAPIRRIKRSEAHKVEQRRQMSTGVGDFYEGQQDDLISELLNVISLPKAVGQHFEPQAIVAATLQGQQARSSTAADQQPAAIPTPTKKEKLSLPGEAGLGLGFRISATPPQSRQPAPATSAEGSGAAVGGGAGGGGGGSGRQRKRSAFNRPVEKGPGPSSQQLQMLHRHRRHRRQKTRMCLRRRSLERSPEICT